MSHKVLPLSSELHQYILQHSLREPEVLRELREETDKLPQRTMQISPEQGQFMRLLVQLMNAKTILEVGTFTGYSSLSMALALPEDGHLVACDISEEWTNIARTYWKKAAVDSKITLHLGLAAETLQRLIDQASTAAFDIAFIDADKANYDTYYERCLRLVRGGGLIVIDNALWDGLVIDETVQDADTVAIRKLNEKVYQDDRVDISLLAVADGLMLARKR